MCTAARDGCVSGVVATTARRPRHVTRDEALDRVHDHLTGGEGRIDDSLRSIGERIGVSARMLIYYFGSREQLLVAVLERQRERQRRWIEELVAAGMRPAEILLRYFDAATAPERRGLLRFFFGLVAEANRDPGRYREFLDEELVGYWRTMMEDLAGDGAASDVDAAFVSLALGAARGLYLELLATGDTEHVRRAYRLLIDWSEAYRRYRDGDAPPAVALPASSPADAPGQDAFPRGVRGWREADLDRLAAIYTASRRAAFDWVDPSLFRDEQFAGDTEGETILVAVDDHDTPTGFVSIWLPQSFIHHLYVDPERRRGGVGRRLLAAACALCADPPWLKAAVRNRDALAFYERLGFHRLDHSGTNPVTGDWIGLSR